MTTISQTKFASPTLAALAGAMLLASLGVSIASVALPTLGRVFSVSISAVQWVILIYLIAVTVAIVLAGGFGDRFGQRRVLSVGLVLFTIASALCALAPTFEMLILGRALQGFGGAILMALPIALVRETVAKERTGAAMGLLATISAFGTALGPSLGGVIIANFGWQAAFTLLAALGALVLGLTLWAIPVAASKSQPNTAPTDWLGAALLALTLIAYALAMAGGKTELRWGASLFLPVALLLLALFILVETRSASPLVPIAILRDRSTSASLVMNLLVSAMMMTTLVVGPFFLFFGLQLNETMVGLVMAVGPLTAACAGIPAGRIIDRFGAPRIMLVGLAETTIGLICLALLPRMLGVTGYIAALMVLTPGFQMFLAANNTAVMLNAREDQRGMLSGLLGLSRNLGFMTGASLMATLFAAALGTQEIATAPVPIIGSAFTTTFLVAASVIGVALILTLIIRQKRRNCASVDAQLP